MPNKNPHFEDVAVIQATALRSPYEHMTNSSSQLDDWYSHSTPQTSEGSMFTQDNLVFGLLLSSPSQSEGFICAFFRPNIIVDSVGHILSLPEHDFDGIVELAHHVCDLPDTGSFRNTWRIKHQMTGREIQRLLVKKDDGSFNETSVYGYSTANNTLEKRIGEFTTLPHVLTRLVGLLQEARVDGEVMQEVIERVKSLLG